LSSQPQIQVIYYEEDDGTVPVLDWLLELHQRQRKAAAKCVAAIQRLRQLGSRLRRPEADYLRDGIHELRTKWGRVNYRILFFFHGRERAVLVHALTKEAAVPEADIQRALRRKAAFERNPKKHTCQQDISYGQND
jgi:phage-related protein